MTQQPPAAYVAARRVGDATVTIISEAAAVGSVGPRFLKLSCAGPFRKRICAA